MHAATEFLRGEGMGRSLPNRVVQLAKMKHLFKSEEAYAEFTGSVVSQIEENGPVVLLLDDERVLFGALPVADAMNVIKEKVVERMMADPERLKTILDRMKSKEQEEIEVLE